MQIISKRISFFAWLLVFLAVAIVLPSHATDLVLSPSQAEHVVLNVKNKHVTAKDRQRNISYDVDSTISRHLILADDIRLISGASNQKDKLFILLVRISSRPGAMGRGYCGAGYEDSLLLVEVVNRKLLLRDHLLLQSCLKSIAMFIDRGDDHPANGLISENNGSFSYRLVDDEVEKKRLLSVRERHFKVDLILSPEQQ